MKNIKKIIIYDSYVTRDQRRNLLVLNFCLISGKERKAMDNNEDSGTGDFVRDDRRIAEILKKVIMSLLSVAVMLAGEFIRKDGD